ncbi:MAG: LPS O-antigen subunit length determinant protein (WzzB/FepE family) [Glaciecola sp.]|jgi:LPS O-antigen subunit length determinant protein (WzzB/FepE family)
MTDNQNKQASPDNVQYVAISSNMFKTQDSADDEIDLREIWGVIWQGKWIIITVTAIFAITSVFYALSLPNIYKSEALLAPANEEQQGGIAGLAGQFGGLASLAGVNLGGAKADKTALAIEVLKSRAFFTKFVNRHNILPNLIAALGWDLASNTVIYNHEIYLPESATWVREVKPPQNAKPSMQEAKEEFDKLFSIAQSADTGMIVISIEHLSPSIAKEWVDWLIEDINSEMKVRDKEEAQRSINYLQVQIAETNIVEQKSLLYQLIEEQAKTLMFAEVRDEYIFKTIDPAFIPEMKYKPQRALSVALITMLGIIIGSVCMLIRYFARKSS